MGFFCYKYLNIKEIYKIYQQRRRPMPKDITIELPSSAIFKPLIENHAVSSVSINQDKSTTEHTLLLPNRLNLVTLIEKRCDKHVAFTFKNIDTESYFQCRRLNAYMIDFFNITNHISAFITRGNPNIRAMRGHLQIKSI